MVGPASGCLGCFQIRRTLTFATVTQPTWELTAFVQLDLATVDRRTFMQINTGADAPGGAECKFAPDGAGGTKFRVESASSVAG